MTQVSLFDRFRLISIAVIAVAALSTATDAQTPTKPCVHGVTQTALNQCADEDFKAADRRLLILYQRLSVALADSSRRSALKSAEVAWTLFRDKQCRFEASAYEGGSMQPMQYSACMAAISVVRANELRKLLADERDR